MEIFRKAAVTLKEARRVLQMLAQPAKNVSGDSRWTIQAFRGYGTRNKVFLMGRVFRQKKLSHRFPEESIFADLLAIWRRISRKGFSGARISADFNGVNSVVTSDRYGFFQIKLTIDHPLTGGSLWQPMRLNLLGHGNVGGSVTANVYIAPETARFVVISDIDDTVIHTGVANKIKMLWRLFVQKTQSRTAFPGVVFFYRALYRGVSGNEFNPMLYISRGPWGIYEILTEFFNLHGISGSPILFLRYWGLDLYHPMPRRAKDHKLNLIKTMLEINDTLPFILIGDSGQKDPEIYTRIVQEHPGRVLAVYIRYVNRDSQRREAIQKLADQVAAAGSSLVLAKNSLQMAEHAARRNLIASQALPKVLMGNHTSG